MVAQPVSADGPRLHRCRRCLGRIRRLDRGSVTRAPERTRTAMTRPKPEKKPETSQFAPLRVLLMELRIGDRLADETGEREVISRPYASAGGKLASAHVRKVGRPEAADLRTLGRTRAGQCETFECGGGPIMDGLVQ